jgi:hypothetical protein
VFLDVDIMVFPNVNGHLSLTGQVLPLILPEGFSYVVV